MANLKELRLPSLHEKANTVEVAAEIAADEIEKVETKVKSKKLKVKK